MTVTKIEDVSDDRSAGFGSISQSRYSDPDLVSTMLEHIKTLEGRLTSLEGDQKADIDLSRKANAQTEVTDDIEDPGTLEMQLDPRKVIPKIRKCNIVQFKNRFSEDEGNYIADVLESGTRLKQDIREEIGLRQELYKAKEKAKGKAVKAKSNLMEVAANLVSTGTSSKDTGSKWISRIRIQSPAILTILSKVVRESWSTKPRTFFRPFSSLIYFHGRMREALAGLESKWGHLEHGGIFTTPSSYVGSSDSQDTGFRYTVDDSPQALAEMRCFVDFMAEEIIPLYTQFENLDDTSPSTKIRFDDLWYLFRTGEEIYRPIPNDTEKTDTLSNRQRTWRVYGLSTPLPQYRSTPNDHRQYTNQDTDDNDESIFKIMCYHIDFTGDEFCSVTEEFKIQRFDGERSVRSLPVYPFRFVTNHERTWKSYVRNGADSFLHYIRTRHSTYNWWTLILNPKGNPAVDADGNEIKHPEHVNSEVIVDFVEAFQVCPLWRPKRSIPAYAEANATTTADDFYIRWWSDSDRTKLIAETNEIICLRSGVCVYERNKNMQEDPFLRAIRENDKHGRLTTAKHLRECDMPLLPIRVFAYVLQDRKFVQIDSQRLRPVKESYNALDSLKINPEYKQTVQALVQEHFMKKAIEKDVGMEGMTQDLIQGKGKGLFILLHGVPGVGKTATAEAVAQANGKPLFAITCGDLGLTPRDVEAALRRIFRLAHIWDCVLLLDEVDTFFSQRSRGDATLTKNALVSGSYTHPQMN
jgi:hypothetical protein